MKAIRSYRQISRPALILAAGFCAAIGIIVVTFASAATALVGDINQDGKVDVFDLSILITKWGTSDPLADVNTSGTVDIFDLSVVLGHWGSTAPTPTPVVTPTPTATPVSSVSSTNPCPGLAAPAQWKHVVVVMFENHSYSSVLGGAAPFLTSMAAKCGTYAAWKDADYKVTGASDGTYVSKPNYATLTSGVSPTTHGLKDDTYSTTSSVDNIFNRLHTAGKPAKVYQSGTAKSCSTSNFSGAYHDPLRYFTDLGGQSSTSTTYCNVNDIPIANFITDLTAGNLPAYSMVLPTNSQNMHDNTIASGDTWAKNFMTPLLDSAQYQSGDTAVFFLFDEDTPIPVVLFAPSVRPGSKPVLVSGSYPISHFSALRTQQEMLGITSLLGDTAKAPSLLQFFNGK